MTDRQRAQEIFSSLSRAGLDQAELYLKSGRSRRFERTALGRSSSVAREQGWAVRASTLRASMAAFGTGVPSGDLSWPEPDGQALRLPAPSKIPPWQDSTDADEALVGETEAEAILDGIEHSLQGELPGSRLLAGFIEEGKSETAIFNTAGLGASFRRRVATLRIEAVGPRAGSPSRATQLAALNYRAFEPLSIGSRLATLLLLTQDGEAPARERGDIVVGSAVAARILSSLFPLLVGPEGEERAQGLRNRQGRVASALVTIIDDGRFPGGVLAAPVDGEGMPTGRRVLIEEGTYRQPLVDWRHAGGGAPDSPGCVRRESWRDLPQIGPSHLFIDPRPAVAVADLLASVSRGYYLLEALGAGRFDFVEDRFRLPVCGFVMRQGRATGPLSSAWLEGSIRALLGGIQAVARDLAFEPLGAMIGSPTLLVTGVGLRATD